jgi:hypothetical protein
MNQIKVAGNPYRLYFLPHTKGQYENITAHIFTDDRTAIVEIR